MLHTTISAIAAIGQNNELGAQNKLLWNIPGELARFRQITLGHPIIMGRKTFESIGRVLPDRTNIIISRDKRYKVEGAIVVDLLDNAIKTAKSIEESRIKNQELRDNNELNFHNSYFMTHNSDKSEAFVIGGGQIFAEAMPIIQRLYLTIVHSNFPQADVFFPNYSMFTKVLERDDRESDGFKYSFLTLER